MRPRWKHFRLVGALAIAATLWAQQPTLAEAVELLKTGKAREALPILLDLHRSHPRDANLCQQIGIAYTQLEELPDAETFYREALRLNPGFLAAHKNLATVLWFLGRKAESEREFQSVSRALPSDPVPHLYLGLAAHDRNDYQAAVQHFEKAGGLASENPEVLPAVLESYLAARDPGFPARLAQRLAAAGTLDAALASRVAALLLEFRRYDLAVLVLETLTSVQKESADGWRMLGDAYSGQHKTEPAFRAYSRAIQADPKSSECYVALAEFASAHGNSDYALETTERGLRQQPASAALKFERGILLALKGDRSGAQANWVAASKIKPEWSLPWLALGVSQLESGDSVQAAAYFQQARTKDPSNARAHYLYATALVRAGETGTSPKRGDAIAALRKAIELDSRDARPYALLGQVLLAGGETEAASGAWQAALRVDPENATALYQLGLLCQKQGKSEQSRRLLDRFQRVKAKKHAEEESLVEILKIAPGRLGPQRSSDDNEASTRSR